MILNYGRRMRRFAMRPPAEDAKINIPVGSIRSGKTWGLHSKIIQLCDYPVGGRKLITGVSKGTIYTNVLTDLFSLIGENNWHYNRQSGDLRLFDSQWMVMGAKDEGSEKFIRGATIGCAVCDEIVLMPQSYFQMLLSRLSPPGARLYGSTNADNPYHWLKTDYLDKEDLIRDGILWWRTFTMEDNPNLDPQYIAEQKRLYTGVFYKRFIEGLWVMAQGAIYSGAWDNVRNTYAEAPLGLYGAGGHDTHIIAVDYGTTNPFVALDGLDDGTTVWWDDEYRWDSKKEMRQKTDDEYADDIEALIERSNSRVTPKIIVDPSAASFKVALLRRGLWVVDANNDVHDGIRIVSTALQQGKMKFHATRTKETQREMQSYAWNDKKSAAGKEEPIKSNDHGPDSVRYGANDVFAPTWRLAV